MCERKRAMLLWERRACANSGAQGGRAGPRPRPRKDLRAYMVRCRRSIDYRSFGGSIDLRTIYIWAFVQRSVTILYACAQILAQVGMSRI